MPASSSPPAVRNPLLVSGVSEITLAVYFGWVIQGMTGGAHVGPFKHRSIVLQAHIDFIIMGAIQIAMSGTRFWKTIDRRILWPFIVACWTNAALFLPGAMGTVSPSRDFPLSLAHHPHAGRQRRSPDTHTATPCTAASCSSASPSRRSAGRCLPPRP
ncbi:hypothetical protein DFJ74DRAFT_693726 [Hyaloraphidium curvatum]|nr:hypothetical protein DFJ74DRAFT_693726 [Hyaloraphidium curvatum]